MASKLPVSVLTLLGICILLSVKVNGRRMLSKEEDMELERQLNILNKTPVQTFEIDGDMFDCIDIYKQPTFDHPLLKDHKIQMMPSASPRGNAEKSSSIDHSILESTLKGEECPSGTVPIRRTTKKDLIRAKLFKTFRLSQHSINLNATNVFPTQYWAQLKANPGEFYGSYAMLSVYGIPNVKADQGTSSSIYVANGQEVVEAGWLVLPPIHHDSRTRFYVHWTADGYQTGCLNAMCPGFVQVNRRIAPGQTVWPLNAFREARYFINLLIYRDPVVGNWWLTYGSDINGTRIGYWPGRLFKSLASQATQVVWGGAASSPPDELSPPMGSGHQPFEGGDTDVESGSIVRNILLVDDKLEYYEPRQGDQVQGQPRKDCYQLTSGSNNQDHLGFKFYFGGRGGCKSKESSI